MLQNQAFIHYIKKEIDKQRKNKFFSAKCFLLPEYAVVQKGFFKNDLYNKEELEKEFFLNKIQVERLINDGILTPKLIHWYYDNNYYYEIQQRAMGEVVLKYNTSSNSVKQFLKIDKNFNNLNKSKQMLFINHVFKRQTKLYQELVDAPQLYYDKLVNDLLIIQTKYPSVSIDSHGGNIIYDKNKGFWLIDLSISAAKKHSENTNKKPEIVYDSLCYFLSYNFIEEHYLKTQMQQHTSLMLQVADKVLQACKNNNIVLNNFQQDYLKKQLQDRFSNYDKHNQDVLDSSQLQLYKKLEVLAVSNKTKR